MSRRFLAGVLVALTATVMITSAASATAPAFRLRDGVSQPIYSYAGAIRETAWVETGQDLDRDGKTDRVAADIIRPAEPTAVGRRVPVIMDVSPYYLCCGRGNEQQTKAYAPDGTPISFPLFYDNYFVPRGYAVVLVDVGGTGRSSGCFDDVASGIAVVNWLNGHANGFSAPDGGTRMTADWTTGSVGAIGKSQDGATAVGMAVSGVDGLKTVVPIEADSNNYAQLIANGAPFDPSGGGSGFTYNDRAKTLCKPFDDDIARQAGTNGDYNTFWQSLNRADRAGNVRASVFSVQGLQDQIVPADQFAIWWDALGRAGVPCRAWLDQAGHVDPFDLQRPQWVATLHRWFDHWLLGVGNGIEDEPAVHLETTPDHWADLPQWPLPGRARTLRPAAGPLANLGSLSGRPGTGTAVVVDDPTQFREDWVGNPGGPSRSRASYTTDPLTRPQHLSGRPSVSLTVSADKPQARLGVALVDWGPAITRTTAAFRPGVKNLTTRSCWGESSAADSACYLDTAADLVSVDHKILAVGWGDLGHAGSLEHGVPLVPGQPYRMSFALNALDHVVPAGHRLGLVLAGTDGGRNCDTGGPCQFFDPAPLGDTLTYDLPGTSITLPIAASS